MVNNAWLPFGSHPDASMRLLCLPHAGAGATVYRSWGAGLAPAMAVCPVQPPGREMRLDEPPFTSITPLVRELAQEIASSVKLPYAIFGHSTGAMCAFEVIGELRAIGAGPPARLFVAGRRAPQLPMEHTELASLDPPELASVLRRLGGTPEFMLEDHELLRQFQPLLAADFAVNEGYEYRPGTALDIPITAFAGTTDPGAGPGLMDPWREQTRAGFTLHALNGGHFAIFERADEVHARIIAELAEHAG
ncbi:MAG TPA: alpha/beta fold hydrolase [Streptosporangiaceae bacterium]|jgi:surfactin synthase thioesterase subunit